MPRANRYVVAGNIYHLTHRCHDRQFLLRFAKDRDRYRKRLREALIECSVSLLGYNITSNHVHLIVYADDCQHTARLMQQAAGELARDYNRRRGRSGAFWEGRYHATMVDSGHYLWECLKYVELNMVRCRVVNHPREWRWSSYLELIGERKRNRLLDLEKLVWLLRISDVEEFRRHLNHSLDESIAREELRRHAKWTESIAIGSREFAELRGASVRNRQQTRCTEETGTWTLHEDYSLDFAAEKQPIGLFGANNSA